MFFLLDEKINKFGSVPLFKSVLIIHSICVSVNTNLCFSSDFVGFYKITTVFFGQFAVRHFHKEDRKAL